jgi:hypothetical protein
VNFVQKFVCGWKQFGVMKMTQVLREFRKYLDSFNPIVRGMFSRAMFQVTLVNEYLRQTVKSWLVIGVVVAVRIFNYFDCRNSLRALAYYHLMDLYGKHHSLHRKWV